MSKVFQSLNAHGQKLCHFLEEEQTISSIANRLGISENRIHKTIEIKFHIHDITYEEEQLIIKETLGEKQGISC